MNIHQTDAQRYDPMNYMYKTGAVRHVEQGTAEIYITFPEEQHSSGTCGGCGLCASRPDENIYMVPVPQNTVLHEGDTVSVEIPEFPFAVSVIMVFILPLVFMVLFPAASVIIGSRMDIPLLTRGWFVVCAGVSGFAAAFGLNFLIDRWFRRKFPLRIVNQDNTEDKHGKTG